MMVTVEAPLRRVARAGLVLALVIAGSITASSDPFNLLFFGTYAAIGAFLALRRPGNAIGWLLIGIAIGFNGDDDRPEHGHRGAGPRRCHVARRVQRLVRGVERVGHVRWLPRPERFCSRAAVSPRLAVGVRPSSCCSRASRTSSWQPSHRRSASTTTG